MRNFISSLIATAIPIGGLVISNICLYILEKKDELNKEKMDLLYGQTSLSLARSAGIIAENNKKNDVQQTGEVDVSRQEFLNGMTRLEYLLDKTKFNESEKNRVREYNGLFRCHVLQNFRDEQEYYLKTGFKKFTDFKVEDKDFDGFKKKYNDEFISRFPNINKI